MRGQPASSRDRHPGRTGPSRGGAAARVGKPSALFGRLVISWESPGLPRPTPSPGRSSAGTAAVPPSPGSSSAERTGARPSPVLLVCSSRSQSPSPAWDAMAPCSGRVGLPICICGQIALQGEREPPTERERAGTEVRPAKEGGSRCHRSGRRRMRRQARRARRGSPSRRKRPRAGSSRGWGRPETGLPVGLPVGFLEGDVPARARQSPPESGARYCISARNPPHIGTIRAVCRCRRFPPLHRDPTDPAVAALCLTGGGKERASG